MRYAQFEERVAGLVHAGEQAGAQEILIDAGGDAHIINTERSAERMGGQVQSTAFEIVPQDLDSLQGCIELFPKLALLLDGRVGRQRMRPEGPHDLAPDLDPLIRPRWSTLHECQPKNL